MRGTAISSLAVCGVLVKVTRTEWTAFGQEKAESVDRIDFSRAAAAVDRWNGEWRL